MPRLFIVATPIGNLSDISARALQTLRDCDLIAAEDTRVTRALLNHFEIDTPCVSNHQHNDEGGRRGGDRGAGGAGADGDGERAFRQRV